MTAAFTVYASVAQRGLTFDATGGAGVVTAVVGKNGTGKTTLVNLLAGLLDPDPTPDGRIEIAGDIVAGPGTWVPPNQRPIALLSQDPTLFPHLSALDNAAFGLRARGMKRPEAHDRAMTQLQSVGADRLADRYPHELSGGQAQRVALARALAVEPQLLLLDEPLAAMDISAAESLRHLLREVLRSEGRSAVMVTHDMADVRAIADDVIVLAEGRVVGAGPAPAMLSDSDSALRRFVVGF